MFHLLSFFVCCCGCCCGVVAHCPTIPPLFCTLVYVSSPQSLISHVLPGRHHSTRRLYESTSKRTQLFTTAMSRSISKGTSIVCLLLCCVAHFAFFFVCHPGNNAEKFALSPLFVDERRADYRRGAATTGFCIVVVVISTISNTRNFATCVRSSNPLTVDFFYCSTWEARLANRLSDRLVGHLANPL